MPPKRAIPSRSSCWARYWYERAAQAGFPPAQYNYGLMLDRGLGGPEDKPAARRWYEAAAGEGLGPAQYALAVLLARGEGGETDPLHAYMWLLIASESGEAQAAPTAEALAAELTVAQREEARSLARQFAAMIR
jgi:TPR repeat protein